MKILKTATTFTNAFKNAGRVREIVAIFARHGFNDVIMRLRLHAFMSKRGADAPAILPIEVRLRNCFEELGPAYIKLGQLLAGRPDIIPESFTTEFERLQDNVSPVPFSEIKSCVETELKDTLENLFLEFDPTPLATASIAQVHAARLRSGESVAVKIQRPGIEKSIHNDVSILRGIAVLIEKYVPELSIFNPRGLVEEFFKTMLLELDFFVEANNIRRIRSNLSHLDKVVIPQTFKTHTTSRVLCLERFEGVRFSDRAALGNLPISSAAVIEAGAEAFFFMVMQDGLFHADLHAGNLFVLPDGRLGIIDFGMVGRLSKRTRDSILVLFTSLLDEDFETLAGEYLNLSQSRGDTDVLKLQKDLMDNISPYIGMALGDVNIGRILMRSTAIAARNHLVVPRELMLLFKAMINLESLGKRLDAGFDLLTLGNRLARQMLTSRYSRDRVVRDLLVVGRDISGLAEMTPRILTRFFRRWSANHFQFEHRNRDIELLSRAVHTLSHAVVLSSLIIGAFASAIAFLGHSDGVLFFGVPIVSVIAFFVATAIGFLGLHRLRKEFRR